MDEEDEQVLMDYQKQGIEDRVYQVQLVLEQSLKQWKATKLNILTS